MIELQSNGDLVLSGNVICSNAFPDLAAPAHSGLAFVLHRLNGLNQFRAPCCWQCKLPLEPGDHRVIVDGPIHVFFYCLDCAGCSSGNFLDFYGMIFEDTPFSSGKVPWYALSDYLEENRREKTANFVRRVWSGR